MEQTKRAYIELHIAVILYGFTAILGKLITVSAVSIVWWRVFISCISFLFIVKLSKILREVPRKQIFIFLAIGSVVALHWITFYGAVKMSNASIALICLATTSFFTSFLEPLILKQKFRWYEALIGVLILPGMFLIVNGVDLLYRAGIIVGLASALFASIFSIYNKKYINTATPMQISAIELFGVWLFISLLAPFILFFQPDIQWMPTKMDLFYLVVLALLCTTLAYVLSMRALQYISAFASNLVVNLEPVYGILLAIALLAEHKDLDYSFYLGVLVICLAVFSYPFLKKRFYKDEPNVQNR